MSFNVPRQNGHMRNSENRSRFAFSRSGANCGWSVDGTVAVNTKPYEYFIVLYFWHALELRKHDCESDTHQRLTTRAGAHDQYRCRREPITPIPRGTVVISGRAGSSISLRLRRGVGRSVRRGSV